MSLLAVRGLEHRFGGLPAVAGIDFAVEAGEVVALIGPNGAGKSTVLKVIAGLLRPTRCEELRFDGQELRRMAVHARRRLGIATVSQTPRIFASMRVIDDAATAAAFNVDGDPRDRAMDALDMLGLADRAEQPTGKLGLQERRKLELARAIAGAPRLILADEPVAGLGDAEAASVLDVLMATRHLNDTAVVWVEHAMPAVRSFADRAVVLDHGAVLAEGVPAQVLDSDVVARAYLGGG